MKSTIFPPIPHETQKAARAVFGRSNFYLAAGDQSDLLFKELSLDHPHKQLEQPVHTTAILYLITVFQYVETLPDILAADALRERVDWKYALHLPLQHPGLKAVEFCQFRHLLLGDQAGKHNLDLLLDRLSELTEIPCKGSAGLEADQVIMTVCQYSRLVRVWNAFNQAMQALALHSPGWLLSVSLPHWYERYGAQHRNLDLSFPVSDQVTLAQAIGTDGMYLLLKTAQACNPELKELREVAVLGEVWREQFEFLSEEKISWRKETCAGCSLPDPMSYPLHPTRPEK